MKTALCDDSAIVDLEYLVHACKAGPSAELSQEDAWLIPCVLHVGPHAVPCVLASPTRGHRDAACEAILALIKRLQAAHVWEDEDASRRLDRADGLWHAAPLHEPLSSKGGPYAYDALE